MNMIVRDDRQLAETLRAFSAFPTSTKAPAPVPPARSPASARTARTLAALVAAASVGAALWLAPDLAQRALSPSRSGLAEAPAQDAPPPSAQNPAPVPLADEVTGSGYVVAPLMAPVYARHAGRIANILVEPGDRVTAGQALLRIDDPDSRFAADQARVAQRSAALALAAARISRDQAEAALRRKEALHTRGVISGEQREDARTAALQAANAVERAAVALEAAQLTVRIAEARLAELTVRAPITGTVTQVSAHAGDMAPDRSDAVLDGAELMTIARFDTLTIDADVAERALKGLRAGLEGEAVLDAFPERPFAVEISRIAPEINAAKGTVTLRLALKTPPPGVRPGMAARIRLTLSPQIATAD
jgi:RND family efflux transporter MFP subunit